MITTFPFSINAFLLFISQMSPGYSFISQGLYVTLLMTRIGGKIMRYPKPPVDRIFDCIVVGSGAGGLTAADVIAKQGASVLVLERSKYLGGYLNPFRWREYTFDTGLHYLGELGDNGRFRKLIRNIGISDRIRFREIAPQGFGQYHMGDFDFELPAGRNAFKKRLLSTFPQRRRDIERFFDTLKQVETAMEALSSMGRGMVGKMKALWYLPTLLVYTKSTYKQVLDRITRDPKLQAIFSVMSGEAGLPPSRVSAMPGMLTLSHYLDGAFYPEGGGGGLRDAMVGLIMDKGGYLRTGFEVNNIRKDKDIFMVSGKKGQYKAKTVIGNADPKVMFDKLIDPGLEVGNLREKARRIRPSLGAFYAFVGTDLDLPALGVTDANIVHGDYLDPEKNWQQVLQEKLPTDFHSFFITSPSLKDPEHQHAPSGKYAIEVVTMMSIKPFMKWADLPSRRRGPEYEAFKNELGMKLLKRVERYIPGLTEHLDFVEFATPLSNLYWVNAPEGGCYGPNQIPEQMGTGRCQVDTPVSGLFLAGAGVYGSGVFPAMASGLRAGRRVLNFLGG